MHAAAAGGKNEKRMKNHPLSLILHPSQTPESLGCSLHPSHSQTLAALGTTGVDHCAAAFGGHTSAEAVCALATNDGRLIGAFHFNIL
jgi:hypothetical protein